MTIDDSGRTRLTARLAAFTRELPSAAIPDQARYHAKRGVLDVLGVMVLGSNEAASQIVRDYVASQYGTGPAGVIASSLRTTATGAALANGTLAHVLDYDDCGLNIGHPTAVTLPAALGVAQEIGASGADLLDALIVGFEVGSRVGRMYSVYGGPYAKGYHGTSVYGTFSSVAATARLLGLTTEQTQHAMGVAATMSSGLRANFGTMTKPFHAGITNAAAVQAGLLARSGFTANLDVLQAPYGWIDVIGGDEAKIDEDLADLGQDFVIARQGLYLKQFPCCGNNLHAIDGLRRLMSDENVAVGDIATIDVTVHTETREILSYDWPLDEYEAKFCLAYNVAAAATDGTVTLDSYLESHIAGLQGWRDRVRVHYTADLPRHSAVLRLTLLDGREVERRHTLLHGSEDDPLDDAEVAHKFTTCSTAILGEAATQRVIDLVSDLERLDRVDELVGQLVTTGEG